MRTKPIDDADRELIAAAETLLRERHVPVRHRCSAALRASSGEIYTGINLITEGQTDVHSEPVALGRAVTAGDDDIETSVAVIYEDDDASKPMRVISACGVCRELFHAFTPEVDIVVQGDDEPVKVPLSELLPAKG